MDNEGIGYVFAAYGLAFGVLVVWLWMMSVKVRRIDLAASDRRGSDESA